MKRMIQKAGILLPFILFAVLSKGQNNPIFKGGNADGWMSVNKIQSSSNISVGGNADGWSALGYIQSSGNIFKGGTNDGWASQNYVQSTTNFFKGGTGDGWDSKNYLQSSLVIFHGGFADGWSSLNTVQSNLNVFLGGQGDGWASTYRPQGPLPVSLLYFTAVKNSATSSLLRWETTQEINTAYFDIESSSDAVSFRKIGTATAAGNSSVPVNYSFVDHNPLPGINYYRLKQTDFDGHFIYSPARSVRFDELDARTVKYYPNPNKGILNIELSSSNASEARVINVINASGAVVNQLKISGSAGSTMQLDLSHYAKGIYFIQLRTPTLNSTERVILE